jgi:adenine deaminase
MTGPDFPLARVGVSIHTHLLKPVVCGVPPLWALQAATLNPVRALGLTDSLGTVAVGKVADLVLLDGDPLEDIWNVSKIQAVIANGRYFDRAALDRLLVEAVEEWRTVGTIRQAAQAQAKQAKDPAPSAHPNAPKKNESDAP